MGNVKEICVICNVEYKGYGNNAEPIKKGDCCDHCNTHRVIPARLRQMETLKQINKYGGK